MSIDISCTTEKREKSERGTALAEDHSFALVLQDPKGDPETAPGSKDTPRILTEQPVNVFILFRYLNWQERDIGSGGPRIV